jgi:hypothetical protein
MSPEISGRAFEEAIKCALLKYGPDLPAEGPAQAGGYRRRRPEDYDRALCLLPRDAVDFVLATQLKEWRKLAQHHGAAVRE